MSKLTIKIAWVSFAAAQWMGAAEPTTAASLGTAGAGVPWVQIVTVLVLTFGAAVSVGLLIDSYFKARESAQPGVDAYIEDMVAANGLHLNRTERRSQ